MKNHPTPNRRAFAALIPATLLLAAPAFAQDVPAAQTAPPAVQVAPPPVVPTVSEPPASAPSTVAPAAIAPVETTTTEAPAPAATRTTRAVTRTTRVTHPAAPVTARAPAAVAPAPVAVTPAEPVPAQVTPAPVEAVAPPPAAPAATTETTTTEQPATWPWVLGGLVALLGIIGLFVMRRRRADVDEVLYEEPYVEPVVQRAPIIAPAPVVAEPAFESAPVPEFLRAAPLAAAVDTPAPAASEDATLAEPEAADVAELTAGDAPIADRPWLEFALRPVRAGISADEALVEFELTVCNAGSVKAKDVRISTFLFASEPGSEAEMERMLIERGESHDDGLSRVTIEPGEGTRVDATLALPKAQLLETTNGSILPVVIADARYTLADGSEGRTSASFTIGVSEEGSPAMSPLLLADRGMHDEVEARLCGVPEHA
jgi:MYXO-CTERM domain-containing protein